MKNHNYKKQSDWLNRNKNKTNKNKTLDISEYSNDLHISVDINKGQKLFINGWEISLPETTPKRDSK